MVVIAHKDTAEILGKPIDFHKIPKRYKRLFYDMLPRVPLYFYKGEKKGVYGCVRQEYGVMLE